MASPNQLSAQDAQFLFVETGNNLGHVTGISVYEPASSRSKKFSLDALLQHVQSRLNVSSIFTRKLQKVPFDLDFPYWVTDKYFELQSHVTAASLSSKPSWSDFCDAVGRFHSRPLNMERPLWEMHLIEGLGHIEGFAPGTFAIATKIHHCSIDGTSGLRFMSALTDIDVSGTPLFPIPETPPKELKSLSYRQMVTNATRNNLTTPVRLAETLLNAYPMLYPALRNSLAGGETEGSAVPISRFNQNTSPHKTFDGTEFELQALKHIKGMVDGATINDVVLAISSGGIRKYLQHHQDLPGKSLVAWAPINQRPKKGAAATSEDGNNISAMTVALYTEESDPLQRLDKISHLARKSKAGKSGLSARLMTDLSQHMPGVTLSLATRMMTRSGNAGKFCNTFISNVPGPQVPVYMHGAKCVKNYGMAPLADGMGLFIATPSYNGKIYFSITTTREIVPDLDFFIQCLRDAHDELLQLTGKNTADKTEAISEPAKKKAAARKTTPRIKKAASKTVKKTVAKTAAEKPKKTEVKPKKAAVKQKAAAEVKTGTADSPTASIETKAPVPDTKEASADKSGSVNTPETEQDPGAIQKSGVMQKKVTAGESH